MAARFVALALVTAVAVVTPAAEAKSPPRGNYGCTFTTSSGTFFAGTLNILTKKKYSVNGKNKGEYSTRRHRIKFKTGAYKHLYYGRWSRIDGSTPKIVLYGKNDDKKKLVCKKAAS